MQRTSFIVDGRLCSESGTLCDWLCAARLARASAASATASIPGWPRWPWWLTQDVALKGFFSRLIVQGGRDLPHRGPVLLAPTHRARWDALMLPFAAGRRVTGRDCRFMVTIDEMRGLQGWFLHRLGCFPVNQSQPHPGQLALPPRSAGPGEQLVVFPEGRIRREDGPIRLHQGLARLALLASGHGLRSRWCRWASPTATPFRRFGDPAALQFGEPLRVEGHGRAAALRFTDQLAAAMPAAERSGAAGGGAQRQ